MLDLGTFGLFSFFLHWIFCFQPHLTVVFYDSLGPNLSFLHVRSLACYPFSTLFVCYDLKYKSILSPLTKIQSHRFTECPTIAPILLPNLITIRIPSWLPEYLKLDLQHMSKWNQIQSHKPSTGVHFQTLSPASWGSCSFSFVMSHLKIRARDWNANSP